MAASPTVPSGLPDLLEAEPGVLGQLVCYGRVSTRGQLLDRQILALEAVGCSKVSTDKQSGRDTRPAQPAGLLGLPAAR